LLDGLVKTIFQQMFGDSSGLEFKPLSDIADQDDQINYGWSSLVKM
jgi:hypothetical protein